MSSELGHGQTAAADTWTAVDSFFEQALVAADPSLERVAAANAKAGLPAIDVTPLQGKFLHLLAITLGARNILEIGTLGGYSTLWFAKALPRGGRIVTLEADPLHARVAQENIRVAGLDSLVHVIPGDARETLAAIQKDYPEPFDLVFIDADKQSTPQYFQWALRLTHPGSLIIVDNVARKGEVIDATSQDDRVHGMRRFIELLASEKRVSATAVQTVGRKGYDGFILARVMP